MLRGRSEGNIPRPHEKRAGPSQSARRRRSRNRALERGDIVNLGEEFCRTDVQFPFTSPSTKKTVTNLLTKKSTRAKKGGGRARVHSA